MCRLHFIAIALFFRGVTVGLDADDMPLSHNLTDFQFWGTPVDGLSAGVHIVPLPTPDPWPDGFRFQVAIRNNSVQAKYAFVTGMHHGLVTFTAIDSSGREYPLREKPGTPMEVQPPVLIAPGTQNFNVVFFHQDEFAATGGNPVKAVIQLCDKPSRSDPQAHLVTIETAPFRLCANCPVQATLPADPMMAQWKKQERDILNRIDQASTPGDKSEAVAFLAYFYIDTYADYDKARALLPRITEPIDNFDSRLMLVTRNLNLTAQQKFEGLSELAPVCPPFRKDHFETILSRYKYAAEHPEPK